MPLLPHLHWKVWGANICLQMPNVAEHSANGLTDLPKHRITVGHSRNVRATSFFFRTVHVVI